MCDTCVFSPECEMTAEDFKKRRGGGDTGDTTKRREAGEKCMKQ